MTIPKADALGTKSTSFKQWLDHPLTDFWIVLSWLGASGLFFGLVGLLGGPTESDAAESVYATWSLAHGNLACAYPLVGNQQFNDLANPFALAAPLYPVISGAAAALFRIGHLVVFPSQQQLGHACVNAYLAIFNWSVKSSAILATIHLSYLAWPFLLVGVIALLRSSGRGRCGWEVMTVFSVACTPTVLMCLTFYFHPQDLMSMGLILAGVAASLKERWLWAGLFLGLAFCSQQFALLVAAPLLVIVPSRNRVRYLLGALLPVVVVDVPLIVATSGRAIKTVLLGSSRVGNNFQSSGGTVLWETNLRGPVLFLISRVAPVVVSMALAWWVSRRFGARVLNPVPMMSLVAASLVIRLVFEENLFGYYFMASSVALILLDVALGRVRGPTLAWIALVTIAFNPVHLGFVSNTTAWTVDLYDLIPIVVMGLMLASVLFDLMRRRTTRLYKLAWIGVAALAGESKLWGSERSVITLPNWSWQLILVSTALVLALRPAVGVAGSAVAPDAVLTS